MITIHVAWLIAIFGAGWFTTITGVIVGAYFVFRTKRESWESVMAPSNKAEAFNLDDSEWGKSTASEAAVNEARSNEGKSGLPIPGIARWMERNKEAREKLEKELLERQQVVRDATGTDAAAARTVQRMPSEIPDPGPGPKGAAFSLAPDEGKRDGD